MRHARLGGLAMSRLGLRAMGISVTRSGAKPAVLVYERGQDSAAVRQNQSLLSERPVVAGSREPVKPRPRPAKANQDPSRSIRKRWRPPASPALYLIDTSGLFRILQDKLRQAWADQLGAGVIATCPIVELEFLYAARSLADRLEKRRLLREVFGWVAMSDRAYVWLADWARHRAAAGGQVTMASKLYLVIPDQANAREFPDRF